LREEKDARKKVENEVEELKRKQDEVSQYMSRIKSIYGDNLGSTLG